MQIGEKEGNSKKLNSNEGQNRAHKWLLGKEIHSMTTTLWQQQQQPHGKEEKQQPYDNNNLDTPSIMIQHNKTGNYK